MATPMDRNRMPPRTLLLVDDDAVMRSRLAQALQDRGLCVVQAEDLGHARGQLGSCRPDLAVLDARLPDGSGLELIGELLQTAPSCKITVLTGYGSMALAVDALRRGAHEVVAKPVDADELMTLFNQPDSAAAEAKKPPRAPSLARAEWEHINRVLHDCRANISEAARRLNIHRRSLQRKLQKYPPNV